MGEAKRKRKARAHWLGADHHVPRAGFCPSCGMHLSGAMAIDTDARPKPGDVSICAHCASVLQFGENLTFRLFPDWRDDPNTDTEQVEAAILVAKIYPQPLPVVKGSKPS